MTARIALAAALALAPALAAGQDNGGVPMSAIDWLSDSLARPSEPQTAPEPAAGAAVSEVTVAPLPEDTGPRPDALGLLPAHVTGLPSALWGQSEPDTIARRIAEERADMLPAMQALLLNILLAELDPPTGGDGQGVFLARVDKLLELGAVDQAHALLNEAGAASPEIVRRWFDAALLIGEEDTVCEAMEAAPDLSPTYPTRVFCLARGGDWEGAVLLMANARALDEITEDEDRLLSRFLDPDLFEGDESLTPPRRMTPLTFRLFEAIGEPVPTTNLPRAFAQADLRANIGWKAQIEAGERLARTGAVSDNQMVGLYTRQKPAASGGVWDRVARVQALEAALARGDRGAVAALLPGLWSALTAAETEVQISRLHGPALAGLGLGGEAGQLAFRMGLLSDRYEIVAMEADPRDPMDRFLAGVAQGNLAGLTAPTDEARAVADGFGATRLPARFADLVTGDRLGEALLRALALFSAGTSGAYDDLADALALLRAVGLEDTARRAALEFLILERRG